MEKFLFQDRTHEERIQMLETAKRAERITYKRNLTEAEIDNESKKLASEVKILANQEEEKKEVMRSYKEQIDGTRARMEAISKTLLDGTVEVTEKCFKVINMEGREVGFYNVAGELVKVRPLIDDDLQMDLFDPSKNQPAGALPGSQNALEAHEEHKDVEDVEAEEVNE